MPHLLSVDLTLPFLYGSPQSSSKASARLFLSFLKAGLKFLNLLGQLVPLPLDLGTKRDIINPFGRIVYLTRREHKLHAKLWERHFPGGSVCQPLWPTAKVLFNAGHYHVVTTQALFPMRAGNQNSNAHCSFLRQPVGAG